MKILRLRYLALAVCSARAVGLCEYFIELFPAYLLSPLEVLLPHTQSVSADRRIVLDIALNLT